MENTYPDPGKMPISWRNVAAIGATIVISNFVALFGYTAFTDSAAGEFQRLKQVELQAVIETQKQVVNTIVENALNPERKGSLQFNGESGQVQLEVVKPIQE